MKAKQKKNQAAAPSREAQARQPEPQLSGMAILPRKAYPLDEARQLLGGISRNLIYEIVHSGQLRSIRVGTSRKRILIPADAIDAFLQGGERQ